MKDGVIDILFDAVINKLVEDVYDFFGFQATGKTQDEVLESLTAFFSTFNYTVGSHFERVARFINSIDNDKETFVLALLLEETDNDDIMKNAIRTLYKYMFLGPFSKMEGPASYMPSQLCEIKEALNGDIAKLKGHLFGKKLSMKGGNAYELYRYLSA